MNEFLMETPTELIRDEQKASHEETSDSFIPRSKDEVLFLHTFLPYTILDFTLNYPLDEPFTAPLKQRYDTCDMLDDVSGFTSMTERYSELVSIGAEQMAFNINRYFEQLFKLIRVSGGDIIKFAGDALFVIWPESHQEKLHA
eukprot:406049_1